MLRFLLECPCMPWEGGSAAAELRRIRDGAALEVVPGSHIKTGPNLLLSYVAGHYQQLLWEGLLDLQLEDGTGCWDGRRANCRGDDKQIFVLQLTCAQICNPDYDIMVTLRREAERSSDEPKAKLLARCFAGLVRALEDAVECGLAPLGVALRYTPPHEYPHLVGSKLDAFVPSTTSGALHLNLPTLHVDGGLSNTRNIEGIPLGGGLKCVRLMPTVLSCTQLSNSLEAHALLLRGALRYSFVPEEDQLFNRAAGAAPYKFKLPSSEPPAERSPTASSASSLDAQFFQIDEACQRHQAVLLDPGKEAAGCGELQAVWDAKRDFDYSEFQRRASAYREKHFPEALLDDPLALVGVPVAAPRPLSANSAMRASGD
jgi:hypothetical protein